MQPTQTEQEEMSSQLAYLAKEMTNIKMKMPKAEAAALLQRETDEKIDELEAKMERKVDTLKQQLFEFEDQVVGADTKKPIRSRIDDLYHIIKCVEQN